MKHYSSDNENLYSNRVNVGTSFESNFCIKNVSKFTMRKKNISTTKIVSKIAVHISTTPRRKNKQNI